MKKLFLNLTAILTIPTFLFAQEGVTSFYPNNEGLNGVFNSAFGIKAGQNNYEKENVFIGSFSGENNKGGSNTFLGASSGQNNLGSGNIFIGYHAGIETKDYSNMLYIENSESNKPLIWGAFDKNIVNINGSLGIDTTNPLGKLHVSTGSDSSVGEIELVIGGTNGANARTGRIIKNTSSPYEMTIKSSDNGAGNSSLVLDNGAGEIARFKGKYLGIGTNNPSAGLHVKHDTGIKIGESASDYTSIIKAADGFTNTTTRDDLLFSTPGGFMFKMDDNGNGISSVQGFNVYNKNDESVFAIKESNGNVGIDTTTPDEKLTVNGSINNTTGSGGTLTLFDNNASRNNRIELGADDLGAYIKSTWGSQGTDAISFRNSQNLAEMTISNTGNVGIGTINPLGKLHVNTTNTNGNYNTTFDGNSMAFENGGQSSFIRKLDAGRLFFTVGDTSNFIMSLSNNGHVGIGTGTTNPDEKLTVKGKIHTEEVRVDLSVPGPDYVFEKYFNGISKLNPSYKMLTIKEIEAYTKANNHLPGIPSSQEMQEDGIQLKEMNLKLLQKIEELTLYTIDQEKKIEVQQELIKEQSIQINLQQQENKLLNKRVRVIEMKISKLNE